mmetsp:Transcript_3698/g.7912  ORF Transcript_3698/g.7912 Transcript_3698/m.7912 type:complete len:353 (+) Transcript_3698:512-1570(+)
MLSCLTCDNLRLLEHAVLALGNIAGDRVEWRNYLLRMQTDEALVSLYYRLGKSADLELMKRLAWTLSNLVRGEPSPQMTHIYTILPVFSELLNGTNEFLISKALWGLSHIARGGVQCAELVINSNCLPKAVECVAYGNRMVHLPAINLVGQISSGDYQQTEELFTLNILDKLSFIIMSRDSEVRKQTFWVLSNLTADSTSQASRVINSQIIYLALKGLTDRDTEVRREATYVFRNIALEAKPEQVMKLVAIGIIPILRESLDNEADSRSIFNLMDVIRVILYYGDQEGSGLTNSMCEQFCSVGIAEVFEQLLQHDNKDVVESVKGVIECYFEEVDDEMDLISGEEPQEFQFS